MQVLRSYIMKAGLLMALCAVMGETAVSCSKSEPEKLPGPDVPGSDTTVISDDAELAAPSVRIEDVTASSFKAVWGSVNGADEYRYEVSFTSAGEKSAVVIENTEDTSFVLDYLLPFTEYHVRISARSDGKTSDNWSDTTVVTSDMGDEWAVVPMEKYEDSGYVYPFASVAPSDENVYYWVSAVPLESVDDALVWVQDDIRYYEEMGAGWDELLDAGLIMKGRAQSLTFHFNGYGNFLFTAVPVGLTMSGITLYPRLFHSHQFWAESVDSYIQHEAVPEDYVGDWILTTSGTIISENGSIGQDSGETFSVTVTSPSDGILELKGWGGERNRFLSSPLMMELTDDGNGYNSFTVSFPQYITEEDGTEWSYTSWFLFQGDVDGQYVSYYYPYSVYWAETVPSIAVGFRGYIANMNRTVIKIVGNDYSDMGGEGFFMMALWPYGESSEGDVELLDGMHAEPMGMYYLVRKDVAEGKILELPDNSEQNEANEVAIRHTSARTSYYRNTAIL